MSVDAPIGEIEKGLRDVPLSTLRAVVESGLGLRIESVFLEHRRRRAAIHPEPLARDVELTASIVATLPMSMRRPLLALVEAASHAAQATRAAERAAGPKWPGTRKPTK